MRKRCEKWGESRPQTPSTAPVSKDRAGLTSPIGISRAVFLFMCIGARFLDTYAPKHHNFRCLCFRVMFFRAEPGKDRRLPRVTTRHCDARNNIIRPSFFILLYGV